MEQRSDRPSSSTSRRSSSSAEKRDKRQGTITGAFAAAAAKKPALPPLEVCEPLGIQINNYDSQNIGNTLGYHLTELSTKRRWIPEAAAESLPQQGRALRRRRASSVASDSGELELLDADGADGPHDWTVGDGEAGRYLSQLRELTSERVMPTRTQICNVVNMVRMHGLHGRKDISRNAFSLLQLVAKLHPSVTIKAAGTGSAGSEVGADCVVTNKTWWNYVDGCADLNLDPFDGGGGPGRIEPFQMLDHLVRLAKAASCPDPSAKAPARSLALSSGDLLLFKFVLSELERDLACRLEVFSAVKSCADQDRRHALLRNSQLWRTFSGPAARTSPLDRKGMVQDLMEIIAAPCDLEQLAGSKSAEEAALDAGELSALAVHLLRMLLHLYGVAEDAGMFLRHGTSRVTTSGGLENVRMGLETALLEGLVGSGQVVPELTQKRAVLCALRPKDRMRLLSMIVAKGHARRKDDSVNYPSLERLNFLYTNSADVGSFLAVDPSEALKYIVDDLRLALNMVDKTADGLALVVSLMAQAAASELSGKELQAFQRILDEAVAALCHKENAAAAKMLSPHAKLSLHAAQGSVLQMC